MRHDVSASNIDIETCQAIWSAVLLRQFRDAMGLLGSEASAGERKIYREFMQSEAVRFFEEGGPEFRAICLAAGKNPDVIRREALRCIRDPEAAKQALIHRKTYRGRGREKGART